MPTGQDLQFASEVNSLWIVFAIICCTAPIYHGFKKSLFLGVVATAVVSSILYLFFTDPEAQKAIAGLFALFMLIGFLGVIKERVF